MPTDTLAAQPITAGFAVSAAGEHDDSSVHQSARLYILRSKNRENMSDIRSTCCPLTAALKVTVKKRLHRGKPQEEKPPRYLLQPQAHMLTIFRSSEQSYTLDTSSV